MAQLLKGKIGLVTGAGSPFGIGRSLVSGLAAAGAKAVYVCDLNLSNVASLQAEVKASKSDCEIIPTHLDVSSDAETQAVLKNIVKDHGRFDFFFANAGFEKYRDMNSLTTEHFDRSMGVMARSIFLALKFGSQAMMVTSPEKPQGGGSIIATSSIAATIGCYADLTYSAAKSAVNGMVESGSVQLSSSNIRVNAIAPGFTQTSIFNSTNDSEKGVKYEASATPEQIEALRLEFLERAGVLENKEAQQYYYNRVAGPEELANVGVFLASDLASAVNGQVIVVDSGKTAAAAGDSCTGKVPVVTPLEL